MDDAERIELVAIKQRVLKGIATTAEIGRGRMLLSGDDEGAAEFERWVASIAPAQKRVDRTAAERKRRQRERESSFEIPDVADRERRDACRNDLLQFGCTYCGHLMKHRPSARMVNSLVVPLQNVILYGGQQLVEFPRGVGKTTWTKIALLWSVVYGHKRLVVVLAATGRLAGSIVRQIKNSFERSKELREDFPALAVPIVALGNNWRRASTQLHNGRPTMLSYSDSHFVLPTVYRDGSDDPVESAAGAQFLSFGLDGAFKGVGDDADRPDLILIDDPQKRKNAKSVNEMDRIENTIVDDAIPSFGQTSNPAIVMTVTPICVNDIAWRFASRKRHPEWGLQKQRYVIAKSARFDDLFPAFRQAYNEDVEVQNAAARRGEQMTRDMMWSLSDRFYREHVDDFAGTEVVDPLNYAPGEVDAVHHLLKLMAKFHDLRSFDAEYQMDVSLETDGDAVTVDEVEQKVNGCARCHLPAGTVDCVAFVDVNTAKGAGLRWGVTAFGPGRVAAVVAYGSWPESGGVLVPANSHPSVKRKLIEDGIVAVVRRILRLPLINDAGQRVIPVALAIDSGYQPNEVHAAINSLRTMPLYGMEVMASLGRSWSQFKSFRREKGSEEKIMVEKNHLYSGVTFKTFNGRVYSRKYLGMHSDYWREIMQKSFRLPPLTSGSCSLYGQRPSDHHDFALEVTYEQLVRVYRDERTLKQAWEWYNENEGHNHYADVLYGCFALAAWKGLYYSAALPSVSAPVVGSGKKAEWLMEAEQKELAEASHRMKTAGKGGAKAVRPMVFRRNPWKR